MRKYSYRRRQTEKKMENVLNGLKKFHWKYRNLILIVASVVVAYVLLNIPSISNLISRVGSLGYIGAFIGGMLFTYALTFAPATATFYLLGENLAPLFIAVVAALGAVVSDYLIFRFVKDRLVKEIKLLAKEIDRIGRPVSNLIVSEQIRVRIWRNISRSRVWKRIIPVISGLIVASPLPDELGVALFGASKYEPKRFILYSYLLNFIGILAITSLARL